MKILVKNKIKTAVKNFSSRQSRFLAFSLSHFLAFFLLSVAVSGATLAEYRGKIENARGLADELISGVENKTNQTEKLGKLRRELPTTEKIEWKGSVVETDNKWFQEKLDEFEKETDSEKREMILRGVQERLSAIEQKLDELENPSASNRSKDEDKRKLSEILKREEYQKPAEKEESLFQKIMRKLSEWFSRKVPETPQMPQGVSEGFGAIGQFLQIALYVLIFAAVGFLIYKLLPFLEGKFRNREKREKKERVILGELIAADESSENLFSEAENLAREGNLRGAIRKGYIALLCELSDRKVIGLAQHKTNRDYLRDVRKKPELHENMNGLTDSFERHWYGFEKTEVEDWEEFRQGYRKAVNNN